MRITRKMIEQALDAYRCPKCGAPARFYELELSVTSWECGGMARSRPQQHEEGVVQGSAEQGAAVRGGRRARFAHRPH
jgi:hypothetical protein